jgi:hypothetical protein
MTITAKSFDKEIYLETVRPSWARSETKRLASVLGNKLKKKGHAILIKDVQARAEELYGLREMRYDRSLIVDPLEKSGPAAIRARVAARLIAICAEQIRKRRLSTPAGFDDSKLFIRNRERPGGLWLCACEYFYEYSKRFGAWKQRAAYLCGKDDSGYWAMRVPSTCHTVRTALSKAFPAEFLKAKEEGRRTWRQGDILAVELKRGKDNTNALAGTRHTFRDTRYLVHPEHKPVRLPNTPVKFFQIHQVQGASGD